MTSSFCQIFRSIFITFSLLLGKNPNLPGVDPFSWPLFAPSPPSSSLSVAVYAHQNPSLPCRFARLPAQVCPICQVQVHGAHFRGMLPSNPNLPGVDPFLWPLFAPSPPSSSLSVAVFAHQNPSLPFMFARLRAQVCPTWQVQIHGAHFRADTMWISRGTPRIPRIPKGRPKNSKAYPRSPLFLLAYYIGPVLSSRCGRTHGSAV